MSGRVRRGLFVGRFQPVHLGHVKAMETILGEVDEMVIVIGSAQHSHELDNPFTAGERVMMLYTTLSALGVERSRYYIIPVDDVEAHVFWVHRVVAYTPVFHIVYSNEPLTSYLFKEANFDVKPIPFYRRDVYSATEVRRRILGGENWEELVPPKVAEFIKANEGDKRLIKLSTTDKVNPSRPIA